MTLAIKLIRDIVQVMQEVKTMKAVKGINALTAKSSIELTSDLTSDTVPRLTTRNIAGISYPVFFLTLKREWWMILLKSYASYRPRS